MAEKHHHESHFHCQICQHVFHRPKAIPCLHTFCTGCLEAYVVRNGENGHFPCPACRQEIYIPEGGVRDFPDNFLILHLHSNSVTSEHQLQTFPTEQLPTYQEMYGEKAFDLDKSDVFVVDNEQSEAVFVTNISGYGTDAHEFTHVSGLAVSSMNGNIIVVDCSLNKIALFSSNGEFLSCFFVDCSVRDVCVTSFNTLLISVSRSGSALLREYGMDGRLIAKYGSFYKHDNPCGVALDCTQKAVVTSLGKNTVHVLTDAKKPCTNFGSKGSGPNHFIQPSYVTINRRNEIVVSDSGNHRIKIHETNGQFLRQMGGQGHAHGKLFYPMGICVDDADNIYVADANNYRVQVFTVLGVFIACPVRRTFRLGVDVKPTNVVLSRELLVVALRGTRMLEVHLYKWNIPMVSVIASGSGWSLCCMPSCCTKSNRSDYEEI